MVPLGKYWMAPCPKVPTQTELSSPIVADNFSTLGAVIVCPDTVLHAREVPVMADGIKVAVSGDATADKVVAGGTGDGDAGVSTC